MENNIRIPLGHLRRTLGALSMGVILALSACQKDTAQKVKTTIAGITKPAEESIPKEQIPARLPELLKSHGEIIYLPEQYDPTKPNLYIIGDKHQNTEIQKNILEILEILHTAGIKKQYVEGITQGRELSGSTYETDLQFDPKKADDAYKRTGLIPSAPFLFEALHEQDIRTVGTIKDEQRERSLIEQNQQIKQIFLIAIQQIVEAMVTDMELSVKLGKAQNLQEKLEQLKTILSEKTETEKEAIIQKYFIQNNNLQKFIDANSEFLFYRTQGRNAEFQEYIGENKIDDAAFTVGRYHLPGLQEVLKNSQFNLFVILPQGINPSEIEAPFTSFRKQEEYRKHILRSIVVNLFNLGKKGEQAPMLE